MNASLRRVVGSWFAIAVCGGCDGGQNQLPPDAARNSAIEQQIVDLNGDPNRQLELANSYVQRASNNGRAYAVRSMIYAELERRPEQIADLDMAIRLLAADPNQRPLLVESIYTRGLQHQADGDDALAIADFTKALELHPAYPYPLQARSFSYLRLGRLDEALSDVNRAIAISPDDLHGFELRSRIRACLNDHEGANSDLDEYRRRGGQSAATSDTGGKP